MHRIAIACGLAAALGAAVAATAVFTTSRHIERVAAPYLYAELDRLPRRDVGVVLGTARRAGSGMNEFYLARISAAADAFHAAKIGHIIVSGSNPSRYYNEPIVMKRDLVERGVPADRITEDYAGLRTLDSVVRADKVMGQKSFTVVSQRFHAARAVYLGLHHDLDVIAYCAADPGGLPTYTTRVREYGARVKALLDVTVLDTQPTYLGDPIRIELQPQAPHGD